MPCDESRTIHPQTAEGTAVEAEKRRRIREYQCPFTEPIVHCPHRRHDLTPGELRPPLYRELGPICRARRRELERYLGPGEDDRWPTYPA